MTKALLLSVAAAFTLTTAAAQDTLPTDVALKTLAGEDFSSADLARADGATIVALWATWCAPCKKELDVYSEFYEEWKEEYGAEIYAVSIDNARAIKKIPAMVEAKGWAFPVLTDDAHGMLSALQIRSIPQIYIIGEDGAVLYEHAGYSPGDEEKVRKVLAEAKS